METAIGSPLLRPVGHVTNVLALSPYMAELSALSALSALSTAFVRYICCAPAPKYSSQQPSTSIGGGTSRAFTAAKATIHSGLADNEIDSRLGVAVPIFYPPGRSLPLINVDGLPGLYDRHGQPCFQVAKHLTGSIGLEQDAVFETSRPPGAIRSSSHAYRSQNFDRIGARPGSVRAQIDCGAGAGGAQSPHRSFMRLLR